MKKNWITGLIAIFTLLVCAFVQAASEGVDMTPDQALQAMKDGNERFVTGARKYEHLDAARLQETSTGQHPFVTLIACSDSRVSPEHIFDLGIGDVFVIRVAGNVCDIDEIGSIEYGVAHLGTPLMVVMGHSHCGAVTAVAQGAELHGSIPQLVDNIKPAVERVKRRDPNATGDDLVEKAVKTNVWQSIRDLIVNSPETRELVKEKKLKVVGAVYHIEDGKVEWMGEHPRLERLLEAQPQAEN
ncbi:MAG: carbonic anhydrase [bacterium]|nr:carbonic anhydrase [bacterium]